MVGEEVGGGKGRVVLYGLVKKGRIEIWRVVV